MQNKKMVTISKTFDFDAAHRLDKLPPEHKCHRLHGHTYRVEIQLRGSLGGVLGMLLDYADLARAWEPIHAALDHRLLNEVNGLSVPTTEVLAWWIYDRLREWTCTTESEDGKKLLHESLDGFKLRVRVYESSTTYAEVGDF